MPRLVRGSSDRLYCEKTNDSVVEALLSAPDEEQRKKIAQEIAVLAKLRSEGNRFECRCQFESRDGLKWQKIGEIETRHLHPEQCQNLESDPELFAGKVPLETLSRTRIKCAYLPSVKDALNLRAKHGILPHDTAVWESILNWP